MSLLAILTLAKSIGGNVLGLLLRFGGGGFFAGIAQIAANLIAFLSTKLGQWVGIILIAVAIFVLADVRRHRMDNAAHRAEIASMVEAAAVRQRARDDAIKAEVSKDSSARIESINKLAADLQQKVSAYEKQIATRGDVCRLTGDDIKRLRKL